MSDPLAAPRPTFEPEAMSQRVRIVVGGVGLDHHDSGMKVFARFMRDAGLEVIYLGPRQTVETMVGAALHEDADFVGYSIYSGIYFDVAEETLALLREKGATDVRVVMGGIIPKQDIEVLERMGVARAFVSGEPLANIVAFLEASAAARQAEASPPSPASTD